MKGNILDEAVNFELNKENYSEIERERIRSQILKECYKILIESKAIFVDKMDELNNLNDSEEQPPYT